MPICQCIFKICEVQKDLKFYVRIRACEKRGSGKQPLHSYRFLMVRLITLIYCTVCLDNPYLLFLFTLLLGKTSIILLYLFIHVSRFEYMYM